MGLEGCVGVCRVEFLSKKLLNEKAFHSPLLVLPE